MWCWTPAPPTEHRRRCAGRAPGSRRKPSAPGGLTRRATAPFSWCRRIRTSASAPTLTRCSTPAGVRRWSRRGSRTPALPTTATPGALPRPAGKGWCSTSPKSTDAGAFTGWARCMRCCSMKAAGPFPLSWRRVCSWITTPIRPNPAGSTCPCWNWRCRRTRKMTATCIISAGSTCFTAAGRTVSARCSGT